MEATPTDPDQSIAVRASELQLARRKRPRARQLVRVAIFAAALGGATAVMDTTGRLTLELASNLGLWTMGLGVVGYRSRSLPHAAVRGFVAAAIMVAVYYIAYALLVAGLDWRATLLWVFVSLVAGPLIGIVSFSTRRADWIGGVATALIAGTLLAEAAHIIGVFAPFGSARLRPHSALAFSFDLVGAAAVVIFFAADWQRRLEAAGLIWLGFFVELAALYGLRLLGL